MIRIFSNERLASGAFAAAAFLLGACGRPSGPPEAMLNRGATAEGFNVLIVLADALRADHLGAYGYPRETSPFVDSLAAEGVLFENAVAPSTFTGQVMTSVFTGRPPSLNATPGWLSEPAADYKTVAELYEEAGYRTAFISPTPVLASERFKAGFQVISQAPDLKDPNLSAHLASATKKFISENRENRFFAYVHFFDPHEPYVPRTDAYARIDGTGRQPSPKRIIKEQAVALSKRAFGPGDPDYEDLILKYDAEIRDVDESLREIYEHLEQTGLADETLIVFISDHGDEFWEHGYMDHAWTLYQETLHVPLVLWAPRALIPMRRRDRVSTMDLYATLAGLSGLDSDQPEGSFNVFGSKYDPHAPRPLLAELLLEDRNLVRSVTMGDWKFHSWIKYVTPGRRYPPAVTRWNRILAARGNRLDHWSPIMKEELYDLSLDTMEQNNVIARFPEVADRLRGVLADLQDEAAARSSEARTTSEDESRLEQLRSLGYIQGEDDGEQTPSPAGPPFEVPLYEPGETLTLRQEHSDIYLPYGWSIPEASRRWTDGNEAMLWFRLESPGDMTLQVRGEPFGMQAVGITVNGRRVATLWPGRSPHEIQIGSDLLKETNRVVFSAPKSTSPRRLNSSSDDRNLGFAVRSITLTPN